MLEASTAQRKGPPAAQAALREDLTQSAIARRLGIPEGTVKVRLHLAREKLRRACVLQ